MTKDEDDIEFELLFGVSREEAADRFAPICAKFINELARAGCSEELIAFSAGNTASAMCKSIGDAELAKIIALLLVDVHMEIEGYDAPTIMIAGDEVGTLH
jgi:hypothetical protein